MWQPLLIPNCLLVAVFCMKKLKSIYDKGKLMLFLLFTGTFLRRSKPSGAPRPWTPKVQPISRPNQTDFKAKPLPNYYREKLNSRDGRC